MGSQAKTVVWFRRDLRIEDNPALSAAAKDGCVLPVFIWCPSEEGQFYPGRVSRWWLKHSLAHLDRSLRSLGTPLTFIRSESTLAALLQCIGAIRATRLVYNHLYDPVSLVRDHKIKSQLVSLGISVQSFNGDLLYEPWEVYDESGLAFTTFDAYWGKCKSMPNELTLLLPPWKLAPPTGTESVQSCSIEEFGLENEIEKSSNALLSRAWSPGWSNADKVLSEFIDEHLLEYSNNRMKVEGTTTSLLSPYLHFGELSVRKIYQNVRAKQIQWAKEGNCKAEESVNFFLRSVGLREYSRYLCFNFPFTYERSLLGNLKHYPWRADEGQFKSWRQGRTGYPLVDAGMRELWATGWIHNRTRVIVASFFVKILLLPWTWGMKYFWDTLLDADLESDILGWQYVSGSLPDGHELKRLDNPEEEEDFDAQSSFKGFRPCKKPAYNKEVGDLVITGLTTHIDSKAAVLPACRLADGKWSSVPFLQAFEERIDQQPFVDSHEHLVELLSGGSRLLAGEVCSPELLPDKPIQRVRPALPDPVGDGRVAALDRGPRRLHFLGEDGLQLLLEGGDLLEDGRGRVLLLLAIAQSVLHQDHPQLGHQGVRRAAGVVDVAEDVLPVDDHDQVLLAEARGVELALGARGQDPLGDLAHRVLDRMLEVLLQVPQIDGLAESNQVGGGHEL
ncbi:cryptochrome 2 [Musa troglodytarum]|uniref:Cryptochrome 2 n=1 Tax=Musa troglodytarum TaxID=320322 RepID=A0A9E7G960_9LILI|nr:cryptochrome 2 [Musa troglodytarum]